MITIAIQKNGRLSEESLAYLRDKGLQFQRKDKALITLCDNAQVRLLHVRDDDVPEYVGSGVADFGIVGKNVIAEKQYAVKILEDLPFATCNLVIGIPKDSAIKTVEDLEGERIATSYPRILGKYLNDRAIHAALIPISGSVEIAPSINLADAICDITQTGNTMRAHDLIPLVTIFESHAVLIGNQLQKNTTPLPFIQPSH